MTHSENNVLFKLLDDNMLTIGNDYKIMEFSVIYGNTIIGDSFFLGHHSLIREKNHIGNNVSIGSYTEIAPFNDIGDNVRIHSRCFIENVIIESGVFIAPGVIFTDDKYPPTKDYLSRWKKTIVRKNASIGAGAIILPGLEIGENAMIGAGAIVTKDVAANTTVAGNPAKKII